MPYFEEFADKTQAINDRSLLQDALMEAMGEYGYENAALVRLRNSTRIGVVWAHFPENYASFYQSRKFDEVDPAIERCRVSSQPFFWSDLDTQSTTKAQKRLIEETAALGVKAGYTVPLHGPYNDIGLISISRRRDEDEDRARLPLLRAMCLQFWTRWLEIDGTSGERAAGRRPVLLTSREIECVKWSKAGKGTWEIGEILGVSEKTVQFHLSNAMDKLGVSNRISCVVAALQRGLIDL